MSTEQLISSPLGDAGNMGEEIQQAEDADITIDVVDDTPEEDRNRKPPEGYNDPDHEDELTEVGQGVRKRIKKLRFDFHQERRQKDAAVRMRDESVSYAQKVASENKQLRELINRGEEALIGEVKSRTENEVNAAKAKLRRAHEEGDSDALVEAQEVLANASYDSRKASEFIPSTPTQEAPADSVGGNPASQTQAPLGQPVPKADAKATGWAKRNPWFRQDQEMTAIALAVHQESIMNGIDPKSDEYYQAIDERIRMRFPEKFAGASTDVESEEVAPRPTGTPRKPSTVVAPARRTTGSKSRKVRMSKTQRALAKKLGITPEQYAAQVIELEKANA